MDQEFKIWLAGFFDGEGCVNITKNKDRLLPRIFISNTNKDVLELIKINCGGSIGVNSTLLRERPNTKPGYFYKICDRGAINLLRELLPYLKVKRLQAECAIDFYNKDDYELRTIKTKDSKNKVIKMLTSEGIERRKNIKKRMHILNKKGV